MMLEDYEDDDDGFMAVLLQGIGVLLMLNLEDPEVCSVPRVRASFEKVAHLDMKRLFRFDFDGVHRLINALQLPDFRLSNNAAYRREEALLILLSRLHAPGRWEDEKFRFGDTNGKLSETYNLVIRHLYTNFCVPLLRDLRRYIPQFQRWAQAIYNASGAIENCVGFLDGTHNRCCRPTVWQRVMYSGHKRDHGLKYLHWTAPDGITYHAYGPDVGSCHDSTLLTDSGALMEMADICEELGIDHVWYADQAFALSRFCITGVRRNDPNATQDERDWTGVMNTDRTSVEWTIGKTSTTCATVTDRKQQKVMLQNLGMQYFVAILITNCHTCLYGSLTSSWFDCRAPELEDYLQL
eukprot:6204463-Pyramimonas_sp.AAC.2